MERSGTKVRRPLPRWLGGHLGLGMVLPATLLFGCEDPRNELQTVVEVQGRNVVVRYDDGRLAAVLNDMDYELVPDQEVKVVPNCDGDLHVAVAYQTP